MAAIVQAMASSTDGAAIQARASAPSTATIVATRVTDTEITARTAALRTGSGIRGVPTGSSVQRGCGSSTVSMMVLLPVGCGTMQSPPAAGS